MIIKISRLWFVLQHRYERKNKIALVFSLAKHPNHEITVPKTGEIITDVVVDVKVRWPSRQTSVKRSKSKRGHVVLRGTMALKARCNCTGNTILMEIVKNDIAIIEALGLKKKKYSIEPMAYDIDALSTTH